MLRKKFDPHAKTLLFDEILYTGTVLSRLSQVFNKMGIVHKRAVLWGTLGGLRKVKVDYAGSPDMGGHVWLKRGNNLGPARLERGPNFEGTRVRSATTRDYIKELAGIRRELRTIAEGVEKAEKR